MTHQDETRRAGSATGFGESFWGTPEYNQAYGRTQAKPDAERADAERLFGLILPRDGYRACAVQWQPKDSDHLILYNRLFENDEQLASFLVRKGSDANVWFSTATFREAGEATHDGFKGSRGEANLHSRRCLHGDVDVGEYRPYVRFEHAKAKLELVVVRLGLPMPIIVRSGHGLHFYWPLSEPVADTRVWRAYAGGILAALVGQGLKLDAPCSGDPVRLLRPPGTFNHKHGMKLPVAVDGWGAGPVSLAAFDKFKPKACKPRGAVSPAAHQPLLIDELPTVLRRCRQLNNFARKIGDVPEPEWKACLGVLAFVQGGRELAHEYSKGHPEYDPAETDKKFDDRTKLSGPTTCKHFQSLDNGHCGVCTWKSSLLASPLSIGRR